MILMAMMVYGIVQVDLESIPVILMGMIVYGIVMIIRETEKQTYSTYLTHCLLTE